MNIKEFFRTNRDRVVPLLTSVGYILVSQDSQTLRFKFDESSKNGSCTIDLDTGRFKRWSNNTGGSIIDAIMIKLGSSYSEAVKYISRFTGTTFSTEKVEVDKLKLWYDNLMSQYRNNPVGGETHDIKKYSPHYSEMFAKDNIDMITQEFFDIRVTDDQDRVCIPWKWNGDVVGMLGRYNGEIPHGYLYKYLSIIRFKKSDYLYGYDQNKEFINHYKTVFIAEAEKSVQQSFNFGLRLTIAVGSSNISENQIKRLKEIGVQTIILAFDEGLDYRHLYDTATKVKEQLGCVVKVIMDVDGDYLTKGSKLSPFDLGGRFFNLMDKKYLLEL